MNREQTYKKIVHFIEDQIISGEYHIGDKIPSVNALKIRFGVSRSSIFLAMNELKSRGLIESEIAVGYYVINEQVKIREKILLLFNEFNAFKEDIYKSFINEIGEEANVDIMFHNYNQEVFETLLKASSGKYTSYVLMPGKFLGLLPLLEKLNAHIVLADHFPKELIGHFSSVGQDFERDTYNSLRSSLDQIKRYNRLILVQSTTFEPEERFDGIKRFCEEYGFTPLMIPTVNGHTPIKGDLYITAEDRELVNILKIVKKDGFQLGKDLGIISYNATPVKEILSGGITTLSTDFSSMGHTLAQLVKDKNIRTIPNPCTLTIRSSL